MNLFVVLYLLAIVVANLTITLLGPSASIATAFVFIGLDLTVRDRLHEAWQRDRLWLRMACLIGAGSLLSYAVNRHAGPIALASFAAFAGAGVADALVYQFLRERAYLVKVNGSNVVSALVDSLIFPALAFGGWLPWIVAGQFAAKVLGGAVWSVVLAGWQARNQRRVTA